jgi:hypothetical protein
VPLAGRRRTEDGLKYEKRIASPYSAHFHAERAATEPHRNRVAASEEPAAAAAAAETPGATSNIIQGKLRRVDKAIIRAVARFDGTMAFVGYGERRAYGGLEDKRLRTNARHV